MYKVQILKRSAWRPEGIWTNCGEYETFISAEIKALSLAHSWDPIIVGPNGETYKLEERPDPSDPNGEDVLLYMVPTD